MTKLKPTKRIKRNPVKKGFYKWTIEIEVDETWVEDGFDLRNDNIHAKVSTFLPSAYGHEIKARVLSAPPVKAIRKAQGYED